MTPRATYRLQFNRDFTFDDALKIVPYLDALGISHVYASPITVARSGSTHGYDVVDPTRIDPALGGEPGFRRLVAALRKRGMGAIIDIVPNHMGVAGGENRWWNDVLANGRDSDFADFFDIDWRRPIVLPVLGGPRDEVIAAGDLVVAEGDCGLEVVAYGEHRFPVRPEDSEPPRDEAALRALLDRQHYRLASWRTANDELNWRRFFTINELAGLRIEDRRVFDATHALVLRLYGEGLIDGVRVDHVDGLADPAGYCRTLRARLDATDRPADAPAGPAYLVVEKILGPGEPLARDWRIDGTSGYDFMEDVAALLHDPAGEAALTANWAALSGRSAHFADEELLARQQLLDWQFAGQLDGCVEAFTALLTEGQVVTRAMLRRAIERLLWVFPVYRTYGLGDTAPAADEAICDWVRERVAPHVPPGEGGVIDLVLGWLGGAGGVAAAEAVRRFQQLSAPIAAKSVEDTGFYRYGRLLSRTDVGFDAERWSISVDAFAAAMTDRAEHWPHAMLATATHDHKRGEDVRARLAVLSERAADWIALATALDAGVADHGVDAADRYMLWQTLVGSWPGEAPDSGYLARIHAWQEKALREAKLRSSWEAPDERYEAAYKALAAHVLADGAVERAAIARFVHVIASRAMANSLVQVALRYTLPGVPDLYQGTEGVDLSLVDPDNRRAVDYDARAATLADGSDPKQALIASLLALRRAQPRLFSEGGFVRAAVSGPAADRVLAFSRVLDGIRLDVAVALRGGDAAGSAIVFADGRTLDPSVLLESPVWFSLAAGG
ncbi:malto-oligosyltrehalose synthase [Sphingomonas sp. Tas61C01]|uniref:malto-oligosyltrehalose synthase n=1 Tax=Sphingomonas sp. Tas61C01 TaxID=3458297 RepID=UPI00403ED5CD